MSKGKVVRVLVDGQGRDVVQFYKSTEKGEPCFRYRVIGGNHERMTHSEAYGSIGDAVRGFVDLRNRTNEQVFLDSVE